MTKEELEVMPLEEKVDWLFKACAEMQTHIKNMERHIQGGWMGNILDDIGEANRKAREERDACKHYVAGENCCNLTMHTCRGASCGTWEKK